MSGEVILTKLFNIIFNLGPSPTPSTEKTSERTTVPEDAKTTQPSPTTAPTPTEKPETKTPTPIRATSEVDKVEAEEATETIKPTTLGKTEEKVQHKTKEEVTVISVEISSDKETDQDKTVGAVNEKSKEDKAKSEEDKGKEKETVQETQNIGSKTMANDETEKEEADLEEGFVVTKITEESEQKGKTVKEPVANDEMDEEEADLESGGKTKSSITVEKVSTGETAAKPSVKNTKTEFKVEKITPSSTPPTKTEKVTVIKVERVIPKVTIETKRNQVHQIDEDEDLKAVEVPRSPDGEKKIEMKVEKESGETPSEKETPSERTTIIKIEKIRPTTDEADAKIIEEEVTEKTTVKSTVTRVVPKNKPQIEKVSVGVEKKSKIPVVKETAEETEEEDLKSSKRGGPAEALVSKERRSDDEPQKTEEEIELELEGGQNKHETKTKKDKPDVQKIAQELDKALKAERNGEEKPKTAQPVKPTTLTDSVVTAKNQQVTTERQRQSVEVKEDETEKELNNVAADEVEILNDETAAEDEESKRVLSDEELELAELARNTMNDDEEEEKKPATEKPTVSTPKEIVIKVDKISKVTVKVTKEKNKMLLSKEETKKEEEKLNEELNHELEQEKSRVSNNRMVFH